MSEEVDLELIEDIYKGLCMGNAQDGDVLAAFGASLDTIESKDNSIRELESTVARIKKRLNALAKNIEFDADNFEDVSEIDIRRYLKKLKKIAKYDKEVQGDE
jgi:hypothetical protein